MKVDPETKKIALSLRRAQPEEWDLIVDKYQVGRVVPGMVTKLVTFGAFARIEGPVEGLIHVSELVDRRIAHPKEVVREGDLLPLKIVRIERDRHRLGLSLRDARDDGVKQGFVFSDAGEVIGVPDDIRQEFEDREGVAVDFAAAERACRDAARRDFRVRRSVDEAPVAAPAQSAAPAPPPEPKEEPRSAMAEAFAAAEAASGTSVVEAPAEAPVEAEAPAEDTAPTGVAEPEAPAEQMRPRRRARSHRRRTKLRRASPQSATDAPDEESETA